MASFGDRFTAFWRRTVGRFFRSERRPVLPPREPTEAPREAPTPDGRDRYRKFMHSWAVTHDLSYRQATQDRLAQTYYLMSHNAPRRMIAEAWTAAGVLQRYRDSRGRERWRYLGIP